MTFIVTPWDVSGTVDYDALITRFGLERIDTKLLDRIEKHAGRHFMLDRGVFLAHRDMHLILDQYEKGNQFYLYTGRGPSSDIHLGHALPWIFTAWLQRRFNATLHFQFTDDEKYLFKDDLSRQDVAQALAKNMADVAAFGFDMERTRFIVDTHHAGLLYPRALDVAKRITYSTAKAVFGYTNQSNIGAIFFTSMQTVPAFLHSDLSGRNIPCLIPHAIDQDPHFRVSRDILPKLGYPKPASIQCRFLPSLQGDGKLSSSEGIAITLHDTPAQVKNKINKYAFSGGKDSVEEHRKHGGNPDIDIPFQYLKMMFEEDDTTLARIESDYRSGRLLSGELKAILIDKINVFIAAHQERYEKVKDHAHEYLLDPRTYEKDPHPLKKK